MAMKDCLYILEINKSFDYQRDFYHLVSNRRGRI